MKRVILIIIYILSFLSISYFAFAQEPKTEIIRLITIEGDVFIKEGSFFLMDNEGRVYKITAEINPNIYNSLLSLTKEGESKNKGLRAQIIGRPGKFHSVIEHSFKYKEDQIESKEARETKFQDFDIVLIKNTTETALRKEEFKISSVSALPPTPQTLPPLLKNIQGKVITTHFDKVIPYVEIKAEKADKAKVILIPSNIQVIKVVEGQLMSLTPKNVIKEGVRLEIWYEEEGEINLAKVITLLPESSTKR